MLNRLLVDDCGPFDQDALLPDGRWDLAEVSPDRERREYCRGNQGKVIYPA